jgi:predicted Rossmann fold nucleotide-binding protein DprA/Smf involved in DNA uptake
MEFDLLNGDTRILDLPKTGFLCSYRDVPISKLTKSYEWAIEQRKTMNCIVSGFHSDVEKTVFHILLTGSAYLIRILAKGKEDIACKEYQNYIDDSRLLILSPFSSSVTKVTRETCRERNKIIFEISDKIVIGHARKGGMIEKMSMKYQKNKIINL